VIDRPPARLSSKQPGDRAAAGAGLSVETGDDGIAVIEFDQPGVRHNRFTPELLERLGSVLDEVKALCAKGSLRGVVLTSAKEDSFILGVDVAAIAAVTDEATAIAATRRGQDIFQQIADLPIPSVAAINGTCLGGATEMALACTWRIAADSTAVEIGLPEVNLGIFPGFGGSQRLPRTISLERALPMVLAGRSMNARRAHRVGLLDDVVAPALLLVEARRRAARPRRSRRTIAPEDKPLPRRLRRWLVEGQPLGRWLVFRGARKQVLERTGGHYPAPQAALETMRRGIRMPLHEALQLEARRVGQLIVSPVCRNLVHIFLSRQQARRAARSGAAATLDAGTGPTTAAACKLGVVGAGVMGGGIAQLAAYHHIPVRLKDVVPGALTDGLEVAYGRFCRGRRAGRLSERDVTRRMGLISPTLEYTGFRRATLIVEAVVEDVEVKRNVLAEIEAAAGADTVIATNTSSLVLAELGTSMRHPERLVGLHFFNPVHRMPLVEVVRADSSADQAVAAALQLAHRLGKVPVEVADAPGFLVNRVLAPYLNEALVLLESGCGVRQIDAALERFGMPMGPLRLLDEVGLDVATHVADTLGPLFGDRLPVAVAARRLRDARRLGRKTGRGFYRYAAKQPVPVGRGDLLADKAHPGEAPGAAEITDRCVLLMLNEACRTLQEGIVASPRLLDLAMVMGTGFAPFRGGVLRYADETGVAQLRDRSAKLAERLGSRFEPAPLFNDAADGSGCFYA